MALVTISIGLGVVNGCLDKLLNDQQKEQFKKDLEAVHSRVTETNHLLKRVAATANAAEELATRHVLIRIQAIWREIVQDWPADVNQRILYLVRPGHRLVEEATNLFDSLLAAGSQTFANLHNWRSSEFSPVYDLHHAISATFNLMERILDQFKDRDETGLSQDEVKILCVLKECGARLESSRHSRKAGLENCWNHICSGLQDEFERLKRYNRPVERGYSKKNFAYTVRQKARDSNLDFETEVTQDFRYTKMLASDIAARQFYNQRLNHHLDVQASLQLGGTLPGNVWENDLWEQEEEEKKCVIL